MDRAQPAEHQAHDERAATRGERERKPADRERQQPDETADDNAQAEEHDVRFTRGTLDVAQLPSDALHVPLGAGQAKQVPTIDDRLGIEGNFLAAADQFVRGRRPARAVRPGRTGVAPPLPASSPRRRASPSGSRAARGPRLPRQAAGFRRAALCAAPRSRATSPDCSTVVGVASSSSAPRRMRSTKTRSGLAAARNPPRSGPPRTSASRYARMLHSL